VISVPASAFCQLEDEDLVLRIAAVLFPDQVKRRPNENGLRIWVDGHPTAPEPAREEALAIFQTCLGVLRSWRSEAGELAEERLGGLGVGTIQDQAGNQWGWAGPAITYSDRLVEQLDELVIHVSRALQKSEEVAMALWVLGRSHPRAAEFFMIYEYAKQDLGGGQRLTGPLGLSTDWPKSFEDACHNLAPRAGGRHVGQKLTSPWTLPELREQAADLLRRWIGHHNEAAG
jgi:hypothetical protein